MRVYMVHGKVQAFHEDGSVEVRDVRTGEQYTIEEGIR